TLYLHLSNDTPAVKLGQQIVEGQQIGNVGTTGNEQGILAGNGLLHFEIRLFPGVFQPYEGWDLPKLQPDGSIQETSNIYIYGSQTAAQLLDDPANTGIGYIDPTQFLSGENGIDSGVTVSSGNVQTAPLVGNQNLLTVQANSLAATNLTVAAQ